MNKKEFMKLFALVNEHISISDLVKETGLSRRTIYYYRDGLRENTKTMVDILRSSLHILQKRNRLCEVLRSKLYQVVIEPHRS